MILDNNTSERLTCNNITKDENNKNSNPSTTNEEDVYDDDKMVMMNDSCNNINHDSQDKKLAAVSALIRPWISIFFISLISAVYTTTTSTPTTMQLVPQIQGIRSMNILDTFVDDRNPINLSSMTFLINERLLIETDDYEPELPPPHYYSAIDGSEDENQRHPHHKPVYNEQHKPLFPVSTVDYYGFGLAILGLMVAAGGGIGGGGILVPIYILVMGFSPKHAIPLSNITVLGGALANTMLNWWKRHPDADRPLIDWDLILVMEPFTVAGALFGAILNKVLPERMISVLLVVLLSFTAWTSLKKAIKMYQKETVQMNAAKESQLTRLEHRQEITVAQEAGHELLKNMEEEIVDSSSSDDTRKKPSPPFLGNVEDEIHDTYESIETMKRRKQDLAIILEEEKHIPMINVVILVVMFAVALSVNVLKGGGAFPSPIGIECGSRSFWFANLFLLLWISAVAIFVRNYLVQRYHRKEQCGYKYIEGDIKWDEVTTITYPVICCFAGFFAGMFGIGGGIVKGPLLLAMGVHPAVGAASTAAMILFTAFAATTSFVVFGLVIPDYAMLLGVIGFVATLVGQLGLAALMKRSKRNSYIAFSIGGVVALSAFLMTIQSVLSMATGEKHHTGGMCGKGD